MQIELENLRTQETHLIPSEGMTFGRAGSNADIQLRDQAVSKRHARVFEEDGAWFLEDLGSSNGTYVDRKKISGRIPLQEGMVFALSRFKFRVARMDGDGAGAPADGDSPLFDNDEPQDALAPPPAAEPPHTPAPPMEASNAALDEPMGATAPPDDVDDAPAPRPKGGGREEPDGVPPPSADGVEGITPGYFMVAVPKAFFQYMAWAPALALAPWVVIPKGIKEQKHQPMGKLELAAYAMPALFISSLLPTLGTMIATLIGDTGFGAAIGGAVFGIITAVIVAIVGGLITGLFGDQITAWLINLLQGESDPRSRTNYFIASFTAMIVVAAPQAIGTAISTIPYVAILSPIILTVGSLVFLFLAHAWMKYFRVHKAIPIIIIVLAVLTILGGLGGTVTTTIAQFSGGGSSDTPNIEIPDPPDPDESDDKDEDEDKDKDKDKAEPKDEDKPAPKDEDEDKPAPKDEDEEKPAPKDDDDTKGKKGKKDKGKKGKKGKKDKKDKKDKGKPKDDAPADPPPADDTAEPLAAGGDLPTPKLDYGDYEELVTELDEHIKANPLSLEAKGAKALYQQISAARYAAKQEFDKKMAAHPEHELVHEAEREASVYRQTAASVQKLHELLGLGGFF